MVTLREWECPECGQVFRGQYPPDECPVCGEPLADVDVYDLGEGDDWLGLDEDDDLDDDDLDEDLDDSPFTEDDDVDAVSADLTP